MYAPQIDPQHVYAKRDSEQELDGQLTMWHRSMQAVLCSICRFTLVEQHELILNFDPQNVLYKSAQTCLITVLRLLQTTSPRPVYFVVGNTHINYNLERGDRKLAQVSLIMSGLSEIERYLRHLGNRVCTILCGDFNSTPASGVYQLLTRGTYDCHTLQISQVRTLQSKAVDQWTARHITAEPSPF